MNILDRRYIKKIITKHYFPILNEHYMWMSTSCKKKICKDIIHSVMYYDNGVVDDGYGNITLRCIIMIKPFPSYVAYITRFKESGS